MLTLLTATYLDRFVRKYAGKPGQLIGFNVVDKKEKIDQRGMQVLSFY